MNRVYYPYWEWEDWIAGLYARPRDIEAEATASASLLSDTSAFLAAMSSLDAWPKSLAHNMTNTEQNRKAWLGQAACCIASQSTSDATCYAWVRMMSERQRVTANRAAQTFITEWERRLSGAETLFGL